MAYRRKHTMTRSSTFVDYRPFADDSSSSPPLSPPSSSASSAASESASASSLAAQAIRASAAHRESSLSSAYGSSAFASAAAHRDHDRYPRHRQDSNVYEYTSMKSLNETKSGFWGVLAKKAKEMLDDDNGNISQMNGSTGSQSQSRWSAENYKKTEIPNIHKGSEAIASSLRGFGGTLKNAFEEGLTIVENRTAGIIQETKKLQIRRKMGSSDSLNESTYQSDSTIVSQDQADYETQLKASRDVANAMAAKAKLLLRELKTVKADLAFAKERCAQLEEENRILRESRQKGANPADDDLIRLQLETLLAEKGRLAHENSVYARENRFLREIVEYHQLTMQDVVYLDEGTEEVTEVYHVSNRSSPARSERELISPALLSRSPTPNPLLPSSPKAKDAPGSPTSLSPKAMFASGNATSNKPPTCITIETLPAGTNLSPLHSPRAGNTLQQGTTNPPA